MSRVSYFQRFSQPENHVTNNTLLILRHFYQASPDKIERVLTALLDTDVAIGLGFNQQIKMGGGTSVPDALIYQPAMRVFFETKMGAKAGLQQVTNHLTEIANSAAGHQSDFLIALTRDPLPDPDRDAMTKEATARGVVFAAVTFSQIVDALRAQCAEFEPGLLAMVDDYESVLADQSLLETRNRKLAVFPCGKSLPENVKFDIYYEPASRPCKRNNRFIAAYDRKALACIGAVETIAVASFADGVCTFETEVGKLTRPQEDRVRQTIEATLAFRLKEVPTRFYLVDKFVQTNARKTSPGPLMGMRYLDITVLVPGFDVSRNYTTEQLADALNGATWT